jgi:hypothetical protein
MSLGTKPSTTTALLAVNALLLLTLVIQNTTKRSAHPPFPAMSMPMGAPTNIPGHNHPPMGSGDGGDAGHGPMQGGEFDPAAMALAALVCPGDPTTTLADESCSGQEADKRRQIVRSAVDQQLPIRKVFDKVIEKYGESALTAQALEIRRSMRRPGPPSGP